MSNRKKGKKGEVQGKNRDFARLAIILRGGQGYHSERKYTRKKKHKANYRDF